MLVTIPFHKGDLAQASALLEWIDELGGCRKHPCLLFADSKLTDAETAGIRKLAKLVFKTVTFAKPAYAIKLSKTGDSPWPVGANWAFYSAAMLIGMTGKDSWLWLEPDCVPLCKGWLNKIEAEYLVQQKPFLGPVIETQNKSFKPQYMNGTSVYPANAIRYFHTPMVDFLNGKGHAFDVAGSSQTVPNCHFTSLIQHGYTDDKGINYWGTHPNPPLIFTESQNIGEAISIDKINKEAVLFHPCKNSSLIDLLRKRQGQEKVAA